MILSDDEVKDRIESPLNLLNRLRSSLTKHVDKHPPSISPCLPPLAADIIPDLEDKIQNTAARSKAMNLMVSAMNELKERLPEVRKPETLANIAYNMSRVVAAQDDNAHNRAGSIHSQIIVYAPQVQSLENFEIIDVVE